MKNSLNLPNALTLFRIILIPVIVTVLLIKFKNNEIWALGIFILASVTDFLDGYLARKMRKITLMGKLLDPVADKMLTSAVFISLVGLHPRLAWMVVIIIAREFAVSGLRMIALTKNITIAASWLGKLKMGVTIATIIALIIGEKLMGYDGYVLGVLGMWLTIILGIVSGIRYFSAFWYKISEMEE